MITQELSFRSVFNTDGANGQSGSKEANEAQKPDGNVQNKKGKQVIPDKPGLQNETNSNPDDRKPINDIKRKLFGYE